MGGDAGKEGWKDGGDGHGGSGDDNCSDAEIIMRSGESKASLRTNHQASRDLSPQLTLHHP